jgi:hypothetical protein
MLHKRILGYIGVETKKCISKTRQRKDRKVVYNPDMGVGSLIIGAPSTLTSRIFVVKK